MVQARCEERGEMITDDICEALVGYIEGGAESELAAATVSVRDTGSDTTIPAVYVGEDGDPEEDDIVRGAYLVPRTPGRELGSEKIPGGAVAWLIRQAARPPRGWLTDDARRLP